MFFLGTSFDEFISGNGIWIIIGCLGLAFIVSVIFLILNILKAKKINTNENKKAEAKIKEEIKTEEIKIEETKTVQEKSKVEPIKIEPEKISKEKKTTYSVTYDKEAGDWVVKKYGAARASKRCKTKAEALEAVEKLSKNNDANVSVHKKDGKFQKK